MGVFLCDDGTAGFYENMTLTTGCGVFNGILKRVMKVLSTSFLRVDNHSHMRGAVASIMLLQRIGRTLKSRRAIDPRWACNLQSLSANENHSGTSNLKDHRFDLESIGQIRKGRIES